MGFRGGIYSHARNKTFPRREQNFPTLGLCYVYRHLSCHILSHFILSKSLLSDTDVSSTVADVNICSHITFLRDYNSIRLANYTALFRAKVRQKTETSKFFTTKFAREGYYYN